MTITDTARELDYREDDGLEVTLVWYPANDANRGQGSRHETDERFESRSTGRRPRRLPPPSSRTRPKWTSSSSSRGRLNQTSSPRAPAAPPALIRLDGGSCARKLVP